MNHDGSPLTDEHQTPAERQAYERAVFLWLTVTCIMLTAIVCLISLYVYGLTKCPWLVTATITTTVTFLVSVIGFEIFKICGVKEWAMQKGLIVTAGVSFLFLFLNVVGSYLFIAVVFTVGTIGVFYNHLRIMGIPEHPDSVIFQYPHDGEGVT